MVEDVLWKYIFAVMIFLYAEKILEDTDFSLVLRKVQNIYKYQFSYFYTRDNNVNRLP